MRAVTSFVYSNGRVLLLRRSHAMKSMPRLWAAISGVLEEEDVLSRARTEIYEETGIDDTKLLMAGGPINIPHHDIEVQPFLFWTKQTTIRLNWENDQYVWIRVAEILQYQTVPCLADMLFGLLYRVGTLARQHYIDAGPSTHGAGDIVSRMLSSTGVYTGGFFRIYR